MLEEKILKLFQYRRFPLLYELAQISDFDKVSLQELLVQLQTSIYKLDHHLETNWNIDLDVISKCWEEIYQDLKKFGITSSQFNLYTSHIKKYQKHELELRKGMLPTRFKLEFFYFYKSCDVKLLRRLIYELTAGLNSMATLPDWRFFDLITEINDDVEDVFEDMETINANAFLISYFLNGKGDTKRKFEKFMDYIAAQSEKRFKKDASFLQKEIHQDTLNAIAQTKSLMNEQFTQLSKIEIKQIKLFQYLSNLKRKRG